MRTPKKLPRKQLEKFSTVFTQLGLVLTLFIVFISLEYKTEHTAIIIEKEGEELSGEYSFDRTPIYVKETPKVKTIENVVKKQPVIKVTVVSNNTETNPVILKPTDKQVTPVVTSNVKEEVEDDVIDEDDDPKPIDIKRVDEIPVFAGCEGLSKKESRKCFDKKIQRLVQRYFNSNLANELGLSSGKKRIFTQFVIDKNGNVSDVKINAPHPKLTKETKRIVSKIPKFTPGKQNGKPVKVKYILPITFKVE